MECDKNKLETISDELREKVCDDGDGRRIITPPAALDVFQHPVIPSDLNARVLRTRKATKNTIVHTIRDDFVAKEVTHPSDIFISPNFYIDYNSHFAPHTTYESRVKCVYANLELHGMRQEQN